MSFTALIPNLSHEKTTVPVERPGRRPHGRRGGDRRPATDHRHPDRRHFAHPERSPRRGGPLPPLRRPHRRPRPAGRIPKLPPPRPQHRGRGLPRLRRPQLPRTGPARDPRRRRPEHRTALRLAPDAADGRRQRDRNRRPHDRRCAAAGRRTGLYGLRPRKRHHDPRRHPQPREGSRDAAQLLLVGDASAGREIPADPPPRRLDARSAGGAHAADPRIEEHRLDTRPAHDPRRKPLLHADARQRPLRRELRRGRRRLAGLERKFPPQLRTRRVSDAHRAGGRQPRRLRIPAPPRRSRPPK